MLPKDTLAGFTKFLRETGIFAVVAFASTYAANLWFEKEKAVENIKLSDSNLIATKAIELWSSILKLESVYSQVDRLKSSQDFGIFVGQGLDKDLEKIIDSKSRELAEQHTEVVRSIVQNEHVIGAPLVRHMTIYIWIVKNCYENDEEIRRIRQHDRKADVHFYVDQNQQLRKLLSEMRLDVASTRDYALRQMNR